MSKKIFGLKKPKTEPPIVMPTIDDEAISQAKRRSLLRQVGRSGRSSTILTDRQGLGG